ILYPTPLSPLFPYTTLFRSVSRRHDPPRNLGRPATTGRQGLLRRRTLDTVVGGDVFGRRQRDERAHVHQYSRSGVRREPRISPRSEEHTSELQSLRHLVCRL